MANLLDGVFDDLNLEQLDDRTALVNEVQGYTGNAVNRGKSPLDFWKNSSNFYPKLSLVACFVLTPSATSTESERVFSVAVHLRRKHRTALTATTPVPW